MRAEGGPGSRALGGEHKGSAWCVIWEVGGVIIPSGELIQGEEEGPGEAETVSSHSDQFGLSSLGIWWTPLCIDRPGPREGPVVVAHRRPLRMRTTGINEVVNGESTE